MKMKNRLLLLSLFALLLAPPAHARVLLSLAGGASKDANTSQLGFGGGLLLDFHLVDAFSFGTGGLVLNNQYSDASARSVYIPGVLGLRLARTVSVSGGGYYNYFTASGAEADYGWRAGARLRVNRIFFDGSYSHGLKDFGGSQYATVLGLIGLYLGVL
jgi:hypothetical protein